MKNELVQLIVIMGNVAWIGFYLLWVKRLRPLAMAKVDARQNSRKLSRR